MAVGLSGNLRDFGIADVFQLIGQQRKTGVLELRSGDARVELVFDAGLIVSAAPATARSSDLDPVADRMIRCGMLVRARAEEGLAASRASARSFASTVVERGWVRAEDAAVATELVTRDTIFEVLRWSTGSFDFRAIDVSHDRDRADLLGAEQILMDGLRMVDEWQSFAAQVPSDETVFQRVGDFERYAQHAGPVGDHEMARAQRVYARIDGRLGARRVIDLARLGTFDGTRCLADLRQAGAIRPLHQHGLRALRRRPRAPGARGRGLRRAAAALVPLAALVGVATWTAASQTVPAPRPGGPVGRHGLADLRQAFATLALENAIEAYRLSRGEWPARLDDLEREGWVEPSALAAPEGRPYYSVHREQGLVLLAPER